MKQEIIASVAKIDQITETAYDFTLFVGDAMKHAQPGQFVSLKCGDGTLLRRPVSIADCGVGWIRVVFDIRGKGTLWLAKQGISSEISVLGPLGNGFRMTSESDKRMLFIGGGIGTPPIHFAAKRSANLTDVVLGFKTADAIIMDYEIKDIANTLTVCTDDGTYGVHGFATSEAEKLLRSNDYGYIYACGPRGMLREVSRLARAYDVPCQISLEERMGCSIGACLVCAVPIQTDNGILYKHVCKDGPVFNAREVRFDV